MKFAISARSANGFSTNPGTIEQIGCGHHVYPSVIGVPISDGEHTELLRRSIVGDKLASIAQAQKSLHPKSFVGARMDPRTGEAVFAYVPGNEPDAVAIERELPDGTPTRFDAGMVPLGRQDEINTALVSNFASLNRAGLKIVGSYTDSETGIVTVAIDPANGPDAEKQLAAVLGSSGLRIVRVDSATWSTPEDARTQPTGRQYGGDWISTSAELCTSSPSAKSNNGNYYTVAAGHCGHPGAAWRQGNSYDPSYPLGSGQGNTLYPPPANQVTDCDCQGIGVLSSTKRTSGILINSNALYLFTSSAGEGNYYSGRTLCLSGAAEYGNYGAIICGHILALNGSVTLTPLGVSVFVYDLIQADFNTSIPGDSGGPYGDGTTWLGVHFGRTNCQAGTCSSFSRSSRVVSNLAIYLQNLGY